MFATSFYLLWKRSLPTPTSMLLPILYRNFLSSVCSDRYRRTTCRTLKKRPSSQGNPTRKLNSCQCQWACECTNTCCPGIVSIQKSLSNPLFIRILCACSKTVFSKSIVYVLRPFHRPRIHLFSVFIWHNICLPSRTPASGEANRFSTSGCFLVSST